MKKIEVTNGIVGTVTVIDGKVVGLTVYLDEIVGDDAYITVDGVDSDYDTDAEDVASNAVAEVSAAVTLTLEDGVWVAVGGGNLS